MKKVYDPYQHVVNSNVIFNTTLKDMERKIESNVLVVPDGYVLWNVKKITIIKENSYEVNADFINFLYVDVKDDEKFGIPLSYMDAQDYEAASYRVRS